MRQLKELNKEHLGCWSCTLEIWHNKMWIKQSYSLQGFCLFWFHLMLFKHIFPFVWESEMAIIIQKEVRFLGWVGLKFWRLLCGVERSRLTLLRKLVWQALHFGHISAHVQSWLNGPAYFRIYFRICNYKFILWAIFWGVWCIIPNDLYSQISALKYLDYLKMFKANKVSRNT